MKLVKNYLYTNVFQILKLEKKNLQKQQQIKLKDKGLKMKNWRRLDNSAKIFPLSTGRKYSTVFRLSGVLKEIIQPAILQKTKDE